MVRFWTLLMLVAPVVCSWTADTINNDVMVSMLSMTEKDWCNHWHREMTDDIMLPLQGGATKENQCKAYYNQNTLPRGASMHSAWSDSTRPSALLSHYSKLAWRNKCERHYRMRYYDAKGWEGDQDAVTAYRPIWILIHCECAAKATLDETCEKFYRIILYDRDNYYGGGVCDNCPFQRSPYGLVQLSAEVINSVYQPPKPAEDLDDDDGCDCCDRTLPDPDEERGRQTAERRSAEQRDNKIRELEERVNRQRWGRRSLF